MHSMFEPTFVRSHSISDAGTTLDTCMGINGSFHSADRHENPKNGRVSVLKEDISILIKSETTAAGAMGIKYPSGEAC